MAGRRRAQASHGVIGLTAATVAVAALLMGAVASASTTKLPKAMVGCWHRHAPALPVGTSAGTWLMELDPNGLLTAFTPGTTSCANGGDFTAHVTVVGTKFTIGAVPVCQSKGAYTWKVAGRLLILHLTRDSCVPRRELYAGVWKKG